MSSNEKANLIADIKRLMNPAPVRRYSNDSAIANKVVDKLFIRLGIVAIIGLLIFLIVKGSFKDKSCRC